MGVAGEMTTPGRQEPQPPTPEPFRPPPPPWSEHYRPELDPDAAQDESQYPAKRKAKATPNLDKVKAMLEEDTR